jgi:hypothetical protein
MRWGRWGVSFSLAETSEVGDISRRLGGYEEMLRLERELSEFQRRGVEVKMVMDQNGKRQLEPKS